MVIFRVFRDCPNDINEAVSTLVFASARCGDLPELRKLRNLFGKRYGQKNTKIALELLPGNLVNQTVGCLKLLLIYCECFLSLCFLNFYPTDQTKSIHEISD